jgi:hypothetical protein
MKKTIMQQALAGRTPIATTTGQYTIRKGSNLHKMLIENGYIPSDINKTVEIVIGAKLQYKTQGTQLALCKIEEVV